jgi:hypothetical protein
LRVVRVLVYRRSRCNTLLTFLDIQALGLFHGFDGFTLDALEELFVGRDVVDETNDLPSGPDL